MSRKNRPLHLGLDPPLEPVIPYYLFNDKLYLSVGVPDPVSLLKRSYGFTVPRE